MTVFGYNYLKIWNLSVQQYHKLKSKIKMKFFTIIITKQKWSLMYLQVGHLQNIYMEHDLYLI